MSATQPLQAADLRRVCDPGQFQFATSAELADREIILGQDRALGALQFGIRMEANGYNVYALGPATIDKHATVRDAIAQVVAQKPVPDDWCYVHNFDEPQQPRALRLPPGDGTRLRGDMEHLLDELFTAIPAAFESESYRLRLDEIEQEFRDRQAAPIEELRAAASQQRIVMVETPTGFAFAPMDKNDEVLSAKEFEALPADEQRRIQDNISALQQRLQAVFRQTPALRKETKEKVKALDRQVADLAVGYLIDAVKQRYQSLPAVVAYLDAVQMDFIENVNEIREAPDGGARKPGKHSAGFHRYQVNLLVDHGQHQSAPVLSVELPNYANLVGRIEHTAHMGMLITNFTMIKPGALHQANGGFLLINALKILQQPYAWDGLLRALHTHEVRIEPLERVLSLLSTTMLEPEPIPLDIKVVLVGDRMLYYLLYEYDPNFRELFKVAADFDETIERTADNERCYAQVIAGLARRDGLRPVDKYAVAQVIEYSARLAGEAQKLSTEFCPISDLLKEANHWAATGAQAYIAAAHVQQAMEQQIHRSDRLRSLIYEEIQQGTIVIETAGETVGQVNGLSVIQMGDFAFGQPSRITATTRLGEGEVVDIERETELGGAIHSKGVLILSNFLAARYARGQPLSISGSLVFEQSYSEVEGDSASLAELCALLSSLSGVPIRQSLAVTGSVNQHGQVQPIGRVNEKIEGYFDVCKAFGLTGEQGVVIPERNRKHLMLRQDVVDAVAGARFHVYAVETVDQALEVLTKMAAGERGADGTFPPETVNGRAEQQLFTYALLRQDFAQTGDTKGGPCVPAGDDRE